MNLQLSKAIILDRDGTLHRDTGYLIEFKDFEPLEGVVPGLIKLQEAGFRLFVASNQSGIARGFFSLEAVSDLNTKIQNYFSTQGIRIEEMVFCPHHPQGTVPFFTGDCPCRKPKPGMLLDLAKRYHLNLSQSYMVGDQPRDVEAGVAAGATGIRILPPGEKPRQVLKLPQKEFSSLLQFALSLKE